MKKAIALILVVLILAGGLLFMRRIDQKDKERMRELYAAVEPLQRQREALTAERENLETDYALQMRDIGTVELLFCELNKEIFSDVYPQMRDRGIVGVLGICTQQYPGFREKLKVEQFSRLLMDGWGSCFVYEKVGNFEDWYKQISAWLVRDGLPIPTAVFFPDNTYDASLDEAIIRCGIKTVIHPAEDGHSATVTTMEGDLWHTGAMPWNYTGVNSDTELLARTSGANLVFTISFRNLWDAYEEGAFTNVLDNWASMLASNDVLQDAVLSTPEPADPNGTVSPENELQKPLLKVVNMDQAWQAHADAETNNAQLARERILREKELDDQIAALDTQIRELYDQWGQTRKG